MAVRGNGRGRLCVLQSTLRLVCEKKQYTVGGETDKRYIYIQSCGLVLPTILLHVKWGRPSPLLELGPPFSSQQKLTKIRNLPHVGTRLTLTPIMGSNLYTIAYYIHFILRPK